MIRFAFKVLIVMVAAGYVIRQAEPQAAPGNEPQILHASYMTGTDEPAPEEVARHLSSFTNAQIVFAQAARDAAGFCDRQALACEAGRELLRRTAANIRDVAASIAGDQDGQVREAPLNLEDQRTADHALPAAPPPRYVTF